jgi:hypothetical protein
LDHHQKQVRSKTIAVIILKIKIARNLQNSYGYLLAIYSFAEALYESASFLPTVLTLIDTKITALTCFYLTIMQNTWAVCAAGFSLLFISFDRLLAALFPA